MSIKTYGDLYGFPIKRSSTSPFATPLHAEHGVLFPGTFNEFIAHQTYLSPAVDGYIVGSEWTKKDLLKKGIPADRIHPLGIPTRNEFYEPHPQHPFADPIRILAMAGSLGHKEMADCLGAIMDNNTTKITAVCGNNKALYKTLSLPFQYEIRSERLSLYGFTKNIRNLMDTHDCIMTKPGGLTTTESILRQIPMIISFMIPGQETENTEFLVDEGMAIRVDSAKDLAAQVDQLARYPHRLPLMRARMKAVADTCSPAGIYSLSESLIQRQSEKVVIFSAGFGAGHQMVTNAISEEFHSRYQTASIREIDLMNWLMPQISQSIYDGNRYFVKDYESLYNRFYTQKEDDDTASVLLAKLMQKKTSKMEAKETPTLLISTFPICTQGLGPGNRRVAVKFHWSQ